MQVSILRKLTFDRRMVGLALIVAGLALLTFKTWRIINTARSLQSRLSQAQALAQSANRSIDSAQVEALLMGARADVLSLCSDTEPLLWLAPRLGWLPGIGGDVQAVPPLLDMADGLTEAGVIVWKTMSPLISSWSISHQQGDFAAQALAQLDTARPQLDQARSALARAAAARASIQVERLSPRLASPIRKLDDILPLAQVGADLALAAPEALGLNGPRTYLILAQNEDEIRPTGGFISGAGRVTVDHGKITELVFTDNNIDDLSLPFPDAPEPILRYMGAGGRHELWVFRDSNLSPDFPTSARQAAYFYTYSQKIPLHGVIAVDQHFVQMVIASLGPINVAINGSQATLITGDNVIDIMREAWNPPGGKATTEWVVNRKGFVGQLAAAIRSQVENNPGSIAWLAVGRALLQALDERHVLIYATQPDLAAALARQGWDGAIHAVEGDYLMAVDANLGYNKSNAVVASSVNYTVDLGDGNARAALEVNYHHAGVSNEPCRQEVPYGQGITYQSLMNLCYYDYLRIYAPSGAKLLKASQQAIPGGYFLSRQPLDSQAQSLEPEAGKSVFALFFVVKPGQDWQASFSYELPSNIVRQANGDREYTLWIQKQPGKSAIPTFVTVNLPPGATLNAVTPAALAVSEGQVQIKLAMATDTLVRVRFRESNTR